MIPVMIRINPRPPRTYTKGFVPPPPFALPPVPGVGVGVGATVAVGDGVGEGVGDGVGDGAGGGVGEGGGGGVGEGVGVGVGDGVGERAGDGETITDGVTEGAKTTFGPPVTCALYTYPGFPPMTVL